MEQYYLDIIIVVIVAMAVIIGAHRGLLRALIAVAALLASLLGAGWCATTFTPAVVERMQPLLMEKIAHALQDPSTADLSGLVGRVVDTIGRDGANLLGEAGRNAAAAMMGQMLQPIVHTVIFIAAFIVLRLVLRLAAIPLHLVERLPVLHSFSKLGGAVLGAVSGAIIVSVGLWACETFAWAEPAAKLVKSSTLAPFFAGGAWINYITGLFG